MAPMGPLEPMAEHEIRAELLGRVIENVLHEVDQANGIDRLTLELRLPHHNADRPQHFNVVIEGRRGRGLALRSVAS